MEGMSISTNDHPITYLHFDLQAFRRTRIWTFADAFDPGFFAPATAPYPSWSISRFIDQSEEVEVRLLWLAGGPLDHPFEDVWVVTSKEGSADDP